MRLDTLLGLLQLGSVEAFLSSQITSPHTAQHDDIRPSFWLEFPLATHDYDTIPTDTSRYSYTWIRINSVIFIKIIGLHAAMRFFLKNSFVR